MAGSYTVFSTSPTHFPNPLPQQVLVPEWEGKGMKRLRNIVERAYFEIGQTTAEYALVMLAAAAVVAVLIAWAKGEDNGLNEFFSSIIQKVMSTAEGG